MNACCVILTRDVLYWEYCDVRKKIPVGARFSSPVQTGPETHPASCKMGTGSFPVSKVRPGRDADPSPPSSA